MTGFPRNSQPANLPRLTVRFIDIDNDALKYDVVLRDFELAWQLGDETSDNRFLLHADHRIQRTTHTHVGDISRARRKIRSSAVWTWV